MTQSNRWLLPDGVEDMLPETAQTAEKVRRQLLDNFSRWGYELITTPIVEYLESLLTGTGNDLNLKTFKVTDQVSGRLMGVRADITPQAARIDSHSMSGSHLSGKGVNRLCYADTVLHTLPKHALTHRCPFQIGCELFGAPALSGDVEVISLMLNSLQSVGIENIHIDLAHVGIYRGLVSNASFSDSLQKQVFDALRRKSVPELASFIAEANDDDRPVLENLRILATASGLDGVNAIRHQIKRMPETVELAFTELERVGNLIRQRFPAVTLGVDFSELRGYNYHTGLIFSAYVHGKGDAVAQGGRYDAIGKAFGCSRPATGFSADLKTIVDYRLGNEKTAEPRSIWVAFEDAADAGLWQSILTLRETERVIQAVEADQVIPSECDRILTNEQGNWVVKPL